MDSFSINDMSQEAYLSFQKFTFSEFYFVAVDGGIEGEVKFRINEVGKMCGGMKSVFKCTLLGMSAKRRLYEGVVVPTALFGAETWNMGAAKRKRLNVMEVSEEYVWSNTKGSGEE